MIKTEIVTKIDLDNGKYTYIQYNNGSQEVLRYGEKWRDETGDNFIKALANRVDELSYKSCLFRSIIDKLREED